MNYKEKVLELLRENNIQEHVANVFFEFFDENVLQRFGMSNKDIDNFCTIKGIIKNSEDCLNNKLNNFSEDYIKDFIEKSLDLLCNFEKESFYEFILEALETGFRTVNNGKTIFDFYKTQNVLSIYIIDIIKKYKEDIDIFELTASFVKFSNFISELVSLAYYEKILTLKVSEVYEKSLKDPLTNFYNRNKLKDVIQTIEFSRSKRYKIPLSIAMIDIDNFKHLNDTYGHTTGDKILKILGDTILKSIRKSDIPIRWGGEEFMILFTHTPIENAKIASEKLIEKTREIEVYKDGEVIKFTVSIGLTEIKEDDESIEKAIERADKALYKAKRNGKNRIEILI